MSSASFPSACWTAISNGTGSISARRSPAFTSCPSWKTTRRSKPSTRARTVTALKACTVPSPSRYSGRSLRTTTPATTGISNPARLGPPALAAAPSCRFRTNHHVPAPNSVNTTTTATMPSDESSFVADDGEAERVDSGDMQLETITLGQSAALARDHGLNPGIEEFSSCHSPSGPGRRRIESCEGTARIDRPKPRRPSRDRGFGGRPASTALRIRHRAVQSPSPRTQRGG